MINSPPPIPRSYEKYFYRLGRSRIGQGHGRDEKEEETLGNSSRGGGCNPSPEDRNASDERYLAPPDGRIHKLVSGVSLYGETPRLEGRQRGWGDRRGRFCYPTVLRHCVHDCTAAREGKRDRQRAACSLDAPMVREGGGGESQDSEEVARMGPPVGGRGSYKIQFQGCRFNTTHTAQIFHLLSTFRRYVGIRRAARRSCNGGVGAE